MATASAPPFANPRAVVRAASGVPTSDGAGVRMTRIISSPDVGIIDPFLLLDEFRSDEPQDFLAGYLNQAYRGFEIVTYMLAGRIRHKDNHGHEGLIDSGGMQWMRAGRGIIHSEIREQEQDLVWGFQLWVNLPAGQKMSDPEYKEFAGHEIPEEPRGEGCMVRVLAGTTSLGQAGSVGDIPTAPLYFDVRLAPGAEFSEPIDPKANACLYIYEGEAEVHSPGAKLGRLERGMLGRLGPGDGVQVQAGQEGARFLLLAARPLNEPIAWQGPFVMNTRAELTQAFDDYQNGRF